MTTIERIKINGLILTYNIGICIAVGLAMGIAFGVGL